MNKKEMDKKKEIQNMERDERFVKRIQLKEAAEDEKEETFASKKPRLDLLDLLNPTASVLDILTASGGKPLPTMSEDQINKETDTGDEVSSNRPGVLDIFDFEFEPMEAPAEDKEAVEVGLNLSLFFGLLTFHQKGVDGGSFGGGAAGDFQGGRCHGRGDQRHRHHWSRGSLF